MRRICDFITKYLAAVVLLAAAAAFFFPSLSLVFRASYIPLMLGCVMFGMGLTLELKDFAAVFIRPRDIMTGIVAQFAIMPSIGYALVKLFGLPVDLAVGVILVGCCPGGTSSNVITYLSRGDVALSVGITGMTTLMAPLMTPLLVKLLAGAEVPVDFWGMLLSIAEVVIAPIALGLTVKRCAPRVAGAVTPFLPAFSSLIITFIVLAVVSANSSSLHSCGLLVVAVVVLHNVSGYAIGFLAGKLLGMPSDKSTALSVEVGMQNSGLACSLAASHFQSMAMATVPGAIFSIWHNISGALLARIFRKINS